MTEASFFEKFMQDVARMIFDSPYAVGAFVAMIMLYILFTALNSAVEGMGVPVPKWLKFGNTFIDVLLKTIFSVPKKIFEMIKGTKK